MHNPRPQFRARIELLENEVNLEILNNRLEVLVRGVYRCGTLPFVTLLRAAPPAMTELRMSDKHLDYWAKQALTVAGIRAMKVTPCLR